MLGWKKIMRMRRPVTTPPAPQPDHAQHQRRSGIVVQRNSRTVNQSPQVPKPATLAGRRLCSTAEVANARTCPVCLDDFAAGTVVGQLPCGHVFCSACIEHWFSKHAFTCTMCRFDLEAGSTHAKDCQH
ncbi:hypothetical protein LZ32DRAFT_608162 [Colletotrichum eremochloae]|nr:hypothetical protein LZ32DRAFT_608162 [Colletotrichum eremochloae]